MSNPNSKFTLRLSPKHKRSRVNEPWDVKSPTPFCFTQPVWLNKNSFQKSLFSSLRQHNFIKLKIKS